MEERAGRSQCWKAYSGSSAIRKAESPRYLELLPQQMDLIKGVWEMLKKFHVEKAERIFRLILIQQHYYTVIRVFNSGLSMVFAKQA